MRTEGLWERWSIMGLVCRRALLRMETWLAGADDWSLTTVAPRRWSCWAVTSIRAMSLSRRHLARLIERLLERVLFRCGSFEGDGGDELIDEAVALATDEGVDFVLAIGDADTAGFARELARRMAALDAGEDGFVPYGCILSEGKVPAVVGTGEVPVFAIIAPELLEGIGSPLRELLGSVCAAA